MRIRWIGMVAAAALLAAGCEKKVESQTQLTQRQRDSILATQPLPGASVVGSALKATDRVAGQAAATNAAVDSLER